MGHDLFFTLTAYVVSNAPIVQNIWARIDSQRPIFNKSVVMRNRSALNFAVPLLDCLRSQVPYFVEQNLWNVVSFWSGMHLILLI